MTLPPFEIHRPGTIAEATALLQEYRDDAALYCGGTELVLLMKLGFAEYRHLISLKRIPELSELRAENGHLHIGAAVTHRQLERSPVVRQHWPALSGMERNVANIRVRSAGSLGGNLCFSDPHSDPASFLLAAEGELVSRRGRHPEGTRYPPAGVTPTTEADQTERVIPIDQFVLGPYQTALQDGEILTAIRVPALPSGAAMAHQKFAFRERPAATAACLVRVEEGRIADARVAVGSVGVVPLRARDAEAMLIGLSGDAPDGATVRAAAEAAAEGSNPVSDLNGSPEYKRNLVRVLVERCFREALANAAP